MRDTKYIESKCFHTGVVPDLIKQLKSMLRVMYKNAQFHVSGLEISVTLREGSQRSKSNQIKCYLSTCAEYNRWRSYRETLTYKPLIELRKHLLNKLM